MHKIRPVWFSSLPFCHATAGSEYVQTKDHVSKERSLKRKNSALSFERLIFLLAASLPPTQAVRLDSGRLRLFCHGFCIF